MTTTAAALRPSAAPPARRWARALEVGRIWPLLVRREQVSGFGLQRPRTLLYASDLHLGWPWTTPAADELADLAARLRPDVTLLGGDLADRRCGLAPLAALVSRLPNVYAISGNHDHRLGVPLVREVVVAGGGTWLDDEAIRHTFDDGDAIDLDGAAGRADGRGRILVAHDPAVFPSAAARHYALVLAGHLHGGQCVLATRGTRLHPGCWFARWTGLRFERGDTTMLVSRGAADTLPLRFNCPREVILCTIR